MNQIPVDAEKRVKGIIAFGERIAEFLESDDCDSTLEIVHSKNGWFSPSQTRFALQTWADALLASKVHTWANKYDLPDDFSMHETVGIISAGNIPLAGLHDILSTILAGKRIQVKPSSQDGGLSALAHSWMQESAPSLSTHFQVVEKMHGFTAIISTGSNNSSRYFNYYFGHVPHIIRKNRTSVGLLTGFEEQADYEALGKDIFTYYGLGCRNVTKLYVPLDFEFTDFFENIVAFGAVANHHKYFHNYEYQLAGALTAGESILTNNFVILRENATLQSGVGVVHFERYAQINEAVEQLHEHANEIQCVVCKAGFLAGSYAFGQAQNPGLNDYADGLDTVAFCLGLPSR